MMSGLCEMKVWCSPLRLLVVSMLVFTNFASLHGNAVTAVNHNLQCVNDYISLINCSLNIEPSPNSSSTDGSYWLIVMELYTKVKNVCVLMKAGAGYFCSVKIYNPMTDDDYDSSDFMEQDKFEVSLCYNQSDQHNSCKVLTRAFKPYQNIKPNPPCCLEQSHHTGQHHFTWMSTYEKYSWFNPLSESLMYQLQLGGDKHSIVHHLITTDRTNFSLDEQKLLPDTEYSARVRSSPNEAFFLGQWSSWSSEVHWTTKMRTKMRTEPSVNGDTFVPRLGKEVFIILSVVVPMVPLALLLCYAPFRKWRQSFFIPTPAPYFHTLYQDCHGDFKSWVVTPENTADMLGAEETLRIDMLTKCAEVEEKKVEEEQEEEKSQHHVVEGSTYSNITNPGCDTSLLGNPYAVSTMSPLSDPGGSLKSLTFSSPPGSPAEVDSGCWLSSHTSLERDPPWYCNEYCNEYCTLTAFQQISPVTEMKFCTESQEQSGCLY